MLYQSPLNIIKAITDDDFQINETNLLRVRKQLLSELNLSGKPTLDIKNKSYSKDEIIKTFDVLLESPDLALHEFIYNNKKLLAYLENENLNYTDEDYLKLPPCKPFQQKLSSLLEARFILQFKKAISKRNFKVAKEFVYYVNRLNDNYRDIHYDTIQTSLLTLSEYNKHITQTIKNNETKSDYVKHAEIEYLGKIELADFLNALPDNFDDIIDTFEVSVINLIYYYHHQNVYDKTLVTKISKMLMKIRLCDQDRYDLIRKNHGAYGKRFKYDSNGIVVVFIILGIHITRLLFTTDPQPIRFNNITFDSIHFVNQKPTDTTNIKPANPLPDGVIFPVFPGMERYLIKNIHYPEAAYYNATTGTVHVSFVVERNGSLSHIKALDSIGNGCETEAIRVVKSMQPWMPGTKNGKAVAFKFTLPVKFTLK